MNYAKLADMDGKLNDAVQQLREPQTLLAMIDCERTDHNVLLRLL